MVVHICIGSSCHIKGSYQVIKAFQDLIKEHKLEKDVELMGSFCMGCCTKGVAAKVDDIIIEDLTLSNVKEKFYEHVLTQIDLNSIQRSKSNSKYKSHK